MREIEIKFRVKNKELVLGKLQEADCLLSKPIFQHDIVYSKNGNTDVWVNSKQGDTVIRLRQEDNKTLLTLKQQQSQETDNLEHEVVVDNYQIMHEMLLLLGWKPVVEVIKIRRKGKIKEYEICLDEVEKLDSFLEIEKLTDDHADPEIIRREIFKIGHSLDLQKENEIKQGYDTQIYILNKYE